MVENEQNEFNYKIALLRISELMKLQPEMGTNEGNELDMLATLVEDYEAVHIPMAHVDPLNQLVPA